MLDRHAFDFEWSDAVRARGDHVVAILAHTQIEQHGRLA
jgi:hypothetical protein